MSRRIDAAPRYSVSAEATEKNLRQCAYALLNHWIEMHRVMTHHLELQPVELLILLATTTGNVQRAVGSGNTGVRVPAREPLETGLALPVSRRAIARITGIPNETVRRHVASMIDRGILVSRPKGVHAPNRLTERKALTAVLELMELHAQCTEQLRGLQAIAARADRPPAQRRAGSARRR